MGIRNCLICVQMAFYIVIFLIGCQSESKKQKAETQIINQDFGLDGEIETIFMNYAVFVSLFHKKSKSKIFLLDFYKKGNDTIIDISYRNFLIPNAHETGYSYMYSKTWGDYMIIYRDNLENRYGREYLVENKWVQFDLENIKEIQHFDSDDSMKTLTFKIQDGKLKRIFSNRWIEHDDEYINNIQIP